MEENPNGGCEDIHLLTTQRQFTGDSQVEKWESSVINIMLLAWIQWRGRSLAGGEHHCVVWVWMEETVQALLVCSVFTLAKRTDEITAEGQTFQTERQQVCLGDGQKDAWTETLRQLLLSKPQHVSM